MTSQRDLKKLARERASQTGERYTQALEFIKNQQHRGPAERRTIAVDEVVPPAAYALCILAGF